MKLPSASALNTRPPAVDKTPDQVGDGCLNSHLMSPVCRIDRAQRAGVRLTLRRGNVGAAVKRMPGFIGLRRGAEDIALLADVHVEEPG